MDQEKIRVFAARSQSGGDEVLTEVATFKELSAMVADQAFVGVRELLHETH